MCSVNKQLKVLYCDSFQTAKMCAEEQLAVLTEPQINGKRTENEGSHTYFPSKIGICGNHWDRKRNTVGYFLL